MVILEIECINREHAVQWDIFQVRIKTAEIKFLIILKDVWGNYGDCLDDWTGQPLNCHMYPQCVPTGSHIPTTGRKRRDFDFENFEV